MSRRHFKRRKVSSVDCFSSRYANVLNIFLFVFPVSVRWRLHFEFVTTSNDIAGGELDAGHAGNSGRSGSWQAPNDIDIETMVWNLPVTLFPTAPMQALHQPSKYTVTIK